MRRISPSLSTLRSGRAGLVMPTGHGRALPVPRFLALLATLLLFVGLAGWLLWQAGPAQAQDGEPPPVDNLRCIAETDRIAFLWEAPEWSGGESASYDYVLTLPDGRVERTQLQNRISRTSLVLRSGSYPTGGETRFRVTPNYETTDGKYVTGAAAELTCYIGWPYPLAITPGNTTRVYGETDAMSYTVSGLVDGEVASDVVTGNLGRTPGDDAGSYAINMGTLAIASAYAQKYTLPSAPSVTTYTITPKAIAYTSTGANKEYDGTAAAPSSLGGSFAAGDIRSGDMVTVSGGTYTAADVGTGYAVTGSDVGGADAGNYAVTLSVSGAITPRAVTAIGGVQVNSRLPDGTTDAAFDTSSAYGTGVAAAELSDFRAGGLVVSGAFPASEAGSHDVSVTYSLQDHGAFKAGNYALSAGAASATLRGVIQPPLKITAISGVKVNARLADRTTDASFDTGGVRVIGVPPAQLADFRAGGLVVSGAFPSAVPGSYDVSVTYSLQDHGSFKAGNYTLAAGIASATLRGVIQAPLPGTCGVQPVAVTVSEVPIVVASTTADYFVLYVRPDLDADFEIPVSVTLGQDGTTTLTEPLASLPEAHYRVEKYQVANPGDVDGDCIDDITELQDLGTRNPVNRVEAIDIKDGAVAIPDHETFERLSFQGTVGGWYWHLDDLEFVKFYLFVTERPMACFQNTEVHRTHRFCIDALANQEPSVWDLAGSAPAMRGHIVYHPNAIAPDGSLGVYRFEFQPSSTYPFEWIARANEVLASSMPFLENNLAYHPLSQALPRYKSEKALYDASRVNVLLEDDILRDVDYISLNPGDGYGYLRKAPEDERPNPRDIVIYETLPNDLPRVAGIITTVPQTPLSHVNLRAVQDNVPNAFIRDALDEDDIDDLIDSHVHYRVTRTGYTLRAATRAEVDAHYEQSRPTAPQTPQRDLSVTGITALSDVGFDDWDAFGVKAANVAVLGTLDFPAGTAPDGFAVPFYFYDEFMKNAVLAEDTLFGKKKWDDEDKFTLDAGTKLSAVVTEMLAHRKFQTDYDVQEEMLDDLRDAIKDAASPQWIIDALTAMHATYPEGQSLRYRSSTNNEDLPGYSGAGLYDSKTQDPDETAEDGIDKSIKGVWASLWNFRAYVEREFHRIDHTRTAMGVLVHPNYRDELVNGVAVSFDPFSGLEGAYYTNAQVGEDLVTNPDAHSTPEELLLLPSGGRRVLAYSNQKSPRALLMSDAQLKQLRGHLEIIHDRFRALYAPADGEPFAMEIEFKITSANKLAIKQARPWVFARSRSAIPVFDAAELAPFTDDTIEYTVGQADPINMVLPAASGGTGTMTYHLDFLGPRTSLNEYAQGLFFDADTRVLSSGVGPEEPRAPQSYALAYWAEDEKGARSAPAASYLAVAPSPSLPEIAKRDYTVGDDVSITLPAAAGGSTNLVRLRYRLEPDVPGLSFDPVARTLSGTLTATGTTNLTYTVTDRNGVSDKKTFDIAVDKGVAAPKEAPGSVQTQQQPGGKYFLVTWTEVSNATGYAVQVAAEGDDFPAGSGVTAWPDVDGYEVRVLEGMLLAAVSVPEYGRYSVRVAAVNTDGAGPWATAAATVVDPATSGQQSSGAPPESESGALPTAVTLALSQTSVSESAGTVTVTATLGAPAPDGGLGGFLLADADGTASADIDFTMPLSIFIPGGQRSATTTITITDDAEDEADETVVMSAFFDLGTAVLEDTITLTITDDDTAGVSITAANPLSVSEGATATYTVVLDSQPTADVTVTASSGDVDAASVSPASHTFTPSTWSTPVTFTVSGVADNDTNDETVGVSHSVTSDDGKYAAVPLSSVSVSVSDTTTPPPQQQNRAPTVASAIADATIVNETGTRAVSLSGVFSDADSDSLTVTAASSNTAKATVSVAADYSSLTVTAKARGTATITVTADDGNGGTVSDEFTITVKAAPAVASAIADVSGLEEGATQDVSLSGVFSDADNDALTLTAASSNTGKATVSVAADGSKLTLTGVAQGTATITVTARDSDGNTVSDAFDVTVAGPSSGAPSPAENLRCIARTDQVAFLWDVPEWSGGEEHAYDYDLTLPDGKREQVRWQGYPLVNKPGEYQAGTEASISVKVVYKLADGDEVSSAAASLTCTVAE